MWRCALTGAVIATGLFHFAVAQSQPNSKPSAKAVDASVVLTAHDNGKDIDLTTTQTLVVRLESNPSTGYGWTVVGDPAPLRLGKASYQKNAKSGTVGAPGNQVFRFSANSAGMANLTLAYRRSWEYNVPPAKTFTVKVNVR